MKELGSHSRQDGSGADAVVVAIAAAAILMATCRSTLADRTEPPPKELEGVGVTEHLGTPIPLDLEFVDSDGKPVVLKQLFDRHRPVVLTMNYSNCPMLCSLQLNGLFEAMKRMPWTIGDQFDMITVSFDPLETSERARLTKQKYLKIYSRAGAAEGWHFLTGREENIKTLADAIGFHYRYSESKRQYFHLAVTFILTSDGRVSRYLYGVEYDPQTLRLSLVEASDGRVGSTTDKILLFCFHYDSESGRYGLIATRLMQFGGGLTVVVVGSVIWLLRRREKKAKAGDSPKAD
jgi:protein SCO1